MNLRLVSIGKDGILRLVMEGSLTGDELRSDRPHPFAAVAGEGWASNRVLLSLQETPYLDSSGIGWLLTVHRAFKAGGGQLVLHSVSPQVRQLFELLQLHRVFAIAADEPAAVTLAQQEVPA